MSLREQIEGVPAEFEAVRLSDEEVLWIGRPVFLPYFLIGVPFLVFGLGWGAFDYFFLFKNMPKTGLAQQPMVFVIFFLLHLAPFYLSILNMFRLVMIHGNVVFALTNQRLLMRGGLFGTDFQSIDYDKVQDVSVRVGIIDRLCGTGSISVTTASLQSNNRMRGYQFYNIATPYETFKFLKELMDSSEKR